MLLSVVPLLFLIGLLVTATAIQRMTDRIAAASGRSTTVLSVSERIYTYLDAESRAVVADLAHRSPAHLATFERNAAQIAPTFATIRRLTADESAQVPLLAKYVATTDDISRLLHRWLLATQAGHVAAVTRERAVPATSLRVTAWQAAKSAFEQNERVLALRRYDDARHRFQQLEQLLLALAAVGIILTLAVAAQFGVRITGRLQRLAENARRLADAAPTEPIEGSDEIAALDAVYREMTRRLERERRVAATLQRALLPQQLPTIPGLQIDTAYVSAGEGADIGGDWYDVFEVSASTVGISAGDVAGHGLRAATIMGAVRQSIRTAARVAGDPGAVLRHVNRVLCSDEPDNYVTAFFGLLDLEAGTLRFALAGHPSPLVVRAARRVDVLASDGLVLGVDAAATFAEGSTTLASGDALVLYTDGIVEVERDYLAGSRELEAAVLAELAAPSDNVADGIQQRIFRRREARDDSAVLYIGFAAAFGRAPDEHLTWTFDARDETAAASVRLAVLAALSAGASSWDIGAIETIFGELVGNVARHTPGAAVLALDRRGAEATLHVADEGAPFRLETVCPDALAEGGRGLFLVRALGAGVTLERTARGNRISVVLPHVAQPSSSVLVARG